MSNHQDTYKTIAGKSEGIYKEKASKFLSFAFPVQSVEEIKIILDKYKKDFYDARHVCYAYMLGYERTDFRTNDDGEPSGTAGKPILGQINSNELTDILIIIVRYFGGTKLGTSGLISAYKIAAADAIENNEIIEKTVNECISFIFEYPFMNEIMRIVKEENTKVIHQNFDIMCSMTLCIRKSNANKLQTRLSKIETFKIID